MNCHKDHDSSNQEGKEKKGLMKHGILMILCCLAPIVFLIALPFFNIKSDGMQNLLSTAAFLLCPLMHIFMMKGLMGHGNKKKEK